ncbi:Avirulence protein (Avh) [Phytophthora palmivora]|uniref:RxLR effector protein n=1 Tax=Phytophthora palmivora TaxID=4796 RepID=A0A2P4XEQ0_9STRA|nr:Avirulence protein (Avh) [Phytophthora palmivora]
MYLKYVILVVGAAHLAITNVTSSVQTVVDDVITNNNIFLSSQEAANEEIRDKEIRILKYQGSVWLENFAKADLEKMSKSESFKLSKFKEWDQLNQEKIIKRLKNTKYNGILLQYLNRRSAAISDGTFKTS